MHDETRCVRKKAVSQEGFASLAPATHRASTIVFPTAEAFLDRHSRGPDAYTYGLHGTPTTRMLEATLSELERGVSTVLLPSGQAAISMLLLAMLSPGDEVLIPDTAYPPLKALCAGHLARNGIAHRIYDPLIGADIARVISDETRLIWVESPGSTTMEVEDLPAIVAVARARGVRVACDNTWGSPLLLKPLVHGADFSVEALTKWVGGHSDLLMGSVTVTDPELHRRLKATIGGLGIGVSPDDAALALRGLDTMAVRLAHSGRAALDIAERVAARIGPERVLHPAFPTTPGHAVWRRDFAGASGLFSIVVPAGAETGLSALLAAAEVFSIGASWGGTKSLAAPQTVDRTMTHGAHRQMYLRLSIGLEQVDDLWADLEPIVDLFAATL
jgi:cystathionine beta-lyase